MKQLLIALFLILSSLPSMAANCSIEEFSEIAIDDFGNAMLLPSTTVTTQSITHTATTQSAAFSSATRYIRVICDEHTFFRIGVSPTATLTSPWMPAQIIIFRGVDPGGRIALCDTDCA